MGSEPANESIAQGVDGRSVGWMGEGTGGYCLLGDLSSNTSRQAARARGMGTVQTRGF